MTGKPQPDPTAETLAYWRGGAAGELRYSWCVRCARALFPPRSHCVCGTLTDWRVSSGNGIVHSFTRVERAPLAAFKADVPYVIALIDLAEGFRIMTNVVGSDVSIGTPVRIFFEPLAGDLFLPQAIAGDAI